MKVRKLWIWLLLPFVVLFISLFFIDAPLRRYMEQSVNHRLKGYTVKIGVLHFHPIGFSLDLGDFIISQDANPVPPVAQIRRISASIHWKALLHGKVVSDIRIYHPTLYINLPEKEKERTDEVPIKKRGFQQAAKRIYPVMINRLQILDGDLTYVDDSPLKQIHFSNIYFRAENIANVQSEKHVYPSPVYLEATVFDSGKLSADGRADFLAKPHLGTKFKFNLEKAPLNHLAPLVRKMNFVITGGTLSGSGEVEYAPDKETIHLQRVMAENAKVDYIHNPETAASQKVEGKAADAAKKSGQNDEDPETLFQVDELEVKNGDLGFVNKASSPSYRLFLSKTEFHLAGYSNQLKEGAATGKLQGKFMGSGITTAGVTFRPESKGPDLDLTVSIEETDLPDLNDLLRATGKFDVVKGLFSFYMELGVKNGEVKGYLKPLFKDVKVYDKEQDKHKKFSQKLYEKTIGGISKLLKNKKRQEVATKADLSGKLDDPKAKSWQVVVRLVQNAFFKAILPGIERETGNARSK
ncbi:MAG TPA: DUF748 domain-containing protein [Candidatus Manganitrophaceae bacterium]|nr:DUF748 domain-containing protein [Candidatus Manganitrophaceae bacterium]